MTSADQPPVLTLIATACFAIGAYNWLLAIAAGVLFLLDAVSGTIWIGLYAAAASFFWMLASLISYHD